MNSEADRETRIAALLAKDGRYPRAAYDFVCQAVSIIAREIARGQPESSDKHISIPQLLLGLKKLLLAKYGCMAIDILNAWNITSTDDFGNIVFSLAGIRLLKTSAEDSLQDFHHQFSFYDAFIRPFQPDGPARPMPIINI